MERFIIVVVGLVALGASAPVAMGASSNVVAWLDDAVPTGAQAGDDGGDSWIWVSSNPAPYSGTRAHQSGISAGLHEHYFSGATQPLVVSSGGVLFTAVYIDPANVPSEIMLQWNDGSSWEHRAYWGGSDITYGVDGTASSYNMGPMPAAGQWNLLIVPASAVGLAGATVNGMAFSLFGGRATWDYSGGTSSSANLTPSGTGTTSTNSTSGNTSTSPTNTTSAPSVNDGATNTVSASGTNSPFATASSTNALPGLTSIDDMMLDLPQVGDTAVHILTPTLLEVDLMTTKAADPAPVTNWNFVNDYQLAAPASSDFAVTVNGQRDSVTTVGFKRRPFYAPYATYDLRVENSLYLQLANPISDNQTVQVLNPNGALWSSNQQFAATSNPLRYSPAIHVNQEGYLPGYAKQAMVGCYAGSLGEVSLPASTFTLINATNGAQVFQGTLTLRQDVGWEYSPASYQQVYQADFTSFTTPGQYRLLVPGMGGSVPFRIDEGVGMCFARAYALGLYHQRCGTNLGLPFTRFAHGDCHYHPASIPMPVSSFTFTWTTASNYAIQPNADGLTQTAPFLTSPQTDLFPYINQGTLDTTGGHHDAGDYSKYTINSASLIHYLMFEVDSLPGVATLDNLGIPESGDGISDVMQEAKWESDYIAKLQDADGGFYFLTYPQNREYESNVTPDDGDPQVVWPKTTSVTAAAVAALAQTGSSPLFKKTFPATAAIYLQKAQLGWSFLTNAINKYGMGPGPNGSGAYQKITSYGDDFQDRDELAWAACQIYLATGDPHAHQLLLSWFNPSDPGTWRWGWWHMSESYGNCIRSYAFAAQSGRVASESQLNPAFLAACQSEIAAAGSNTLQWSQQSAYGTSFPPATKAVQNAGWYFSCDAAFDMIVAYQLSPNTNYLSALVANINYEGGCNPANASFVTGLGWKRQRDIVSQWAVNDTRVLPPSGIPIGNIWNNYEYLNWSYQGELEELAFPSDGEAGPPFPFYDRWEDGWNTETEMVILNQARGLGALAFLAARTAYQTQPWQAVSASIVVPSGVSPVGSNVTVSMQAPGLDLTTARITWEARDQQPAFGQTFTFAPVNNGPQWVEAEAQFPDGRRVFASNFFSANSPNIVWVEDSVPVGAQTGSDGGDTWNWVSSNPTPYSGVLAQESSIASGEHQVYFDYATATLALGTNDTLYCWVYLDPAHTPSEVMLQWNDGSSWEHRAYWGANTLTFGTDGTAGRTNMGALPSAGRWAQLTVPVGRAGLAGSTLSGMAFSLYGGRATFDCAGRTSPMTTVAIASTTSNQTVTVSASKAVASRDGLTAGTFMLTRTGDVSSPLNVNYTLGGNATVDVDYQVSQSAQSSTLNFPAGSNSASITVTPLIASNIVGPRNIVMTVGPAADYSVGPSGAATISLTGNSISVTSMQMVAGSPTFSWPSASNAAYRVFYKNNLNDPAWTVAGPDVPAAGAITTWADTSNAAATQRFYVLIQVQ